MNNNRMKCFLICALLVVLGLFFGGEDAFAETSGVVRINDSVTSGHAGGGGIWTSCKGEASHYLASCTGASWIYYKAIAETEQESVTFGGSSTNLFICNRNGGNCIEGEQVTIPKECTKNNGGFWHYGFNGDGIRWGGGTRFQTSLLNMDLYDIELGAWGHWATVGYGLQSMSNILDSFSGNYFGLISPYMSTSFNLGHTIYDNSGKAIFVSEKTSSEGDLDGDFRRTCMVSDDIADKSLCEGGVPIGTYLFCSWGDSSYSGLSEVSGGSAEVSTNIVPKESKTEVSTELKVDVNETVNLEFLHNIYSAEPGGEIYWEVDRDEALAYDTTDKYEIKRRESELLSVGKYGRSFVKVDNFKNISKYAPIYKTSFSSRIMDRGYYVVSDKGFILKDNVDIEFKVKGSYTFCETLKMSEEYNDNNDSGLPGLGSVDFTSKACIKIVVGDGEQTLPECPDIDLGDPEDDEWSRSHVVSFVKNKNLDKRGGEYSGWRYVVDKIPEPTVETNVTYARPNDMIEWVNCYYADAQAGADVEIVYLYENGILLFNGHAPDSGDEDNRNNTVSFGKNWNNSVTFTTDSPSGWSNNDPMAALRENGKLVWEVQVSREVGNTAGEIKENKHKINNKVYTNREKYDDKDIGLSDVGREYYDRIILDSGSPQRSRIETVDPPHKWTYKWRCCDDDGCDTCSREHHHLNDVNYGYYTVDGVDAAGNVIEKLMSKSIVRIPYNFENTASLSMSGENNVAYSAGTVTVGSVAVTVGARKNEVVNDTYATRVDGAKVKLVAYVTSENDSTKGSWVVRASSSADVCGFVTPVIPSLCNVAQEINKDALNTGDDSDDSYDSAGKTYNGSVRGIDFNGVYNVFDAKAGDWFCMTIAMYPASSFSPDKGDKTMDKNGDGSWRLAQPACLQIAKKPSFQVLGGGMYSTGSVETYVSEKNNIFGLYNTSKPHSDTTPTIFGSWIEEELILKDGTVTNLASGAGLGKNNNETVSGLKGNGVNGVFCPHLVALTFANNIEGGCGNGSVGQSGIEPITTNREALADYWGSGDGTGLYPNFDLGGPVGAVIWSANGKDIRVLDDINQNMTIGGSELYIGQTRVVKAKNVTINGDIVYRGDVYGSVGEVPKAVIYAEENISISCYVSRVDALLIAKNVVNTCAEAGEETSIDAEIRSKSQLVINGAVIADKIELRRTYGNTMGFVRHQDKNNKWIGNWNIGSNTPAEVINYDSSLMLWGEGMAGASESDTFTVTYQHELAPRY